MYQKINEPLINETFVIDPAWLEYGTNNIVIKASDNASNYITVNALNILYDPVTPDFVPINSVSYNRWFLSEPDWLKSIDKVF